MKVPESPKEEAREVSVSFVRDDALVPKPKARIPTTDEHGRAPRNRSSRHIDFVDDGKLFEGHFTLQASNLKAVIQYVLERHNEQDIVIQDLQKQVHMLRTRSLKSTKRSGGIEGSGLVPGRPTSSTTGTDLNKRLRSVEQFLQLWGVRLGDVADLVEEYGDPTITPDVYTSYLLDLPVFRLTRREARSLIAAAAQPTASSVNAAAASDTATRRCLSVGKRGAGSASPQEERSRSVTPEKRSKKGAEGDDVVAAATLEKANAALEKAEILLAELHNVAPRSASQAPLKPRRSDQPAKSSSGGAAVDAEARAGIEELGEYVAQRFEEMDARTAMALRSAASSSQAGRAAPQQASGGGAVKKNASAAAQSSPPGGGGRAEEFVDSVAREDAATSLDLLEELEATMERRFKELNSAVASVAARAAAAAKNSASSNSNNNDNDNAPHRSQSPATGARSYAQSAVEESRRAKEQNAAAAAAAAPREAGDAAESRGSQAATSRNSSAAAKKNGSPSRKGLPDSSETSALIPVLPIAPAVLVDQAARDQTIALADRVSDLEEELLDRWQAMEERLRIIGRAAMKQGITNAAAGNTAGGPGMGRAPMVDRKAREDAAMSLMRLQQVEKDLALLKRNAAAMPLHAGDTAVAEGAGAMALPAVMAPLESQPPLRDTYGSKVADLEREVEQRMAEVNQAIAQLRGSGCGDAMPLALSPQKSGRSITLVTPVAFSQSPPQRTSAAPPPSTSQLTLLSGNTHSLVLPADAAPTTSPEVEERRRAAQRQLVKLGYNVDSDHSGRCSDFPCTSVKVGGRRTTISRLRSPDVPPFGSHLVQREVVDIPLMVERPAAGEGVGGTAATPVRAVRRVSNAKGDVPVSPESHEHSRSPPHCPNAGGNAARVSVI